MDLNKKKRNFLIPALAVFCFVYIIFSMRPTGTETHFTPEWTEDINHTRKNSSSSKLIPFKLDDKAGYFTEDGKIVSLIAFPFKAAISENWYCTYGQNNVSCDFFFADGTKAGTIEEAGFPYFYENRIYLMLPGGTSFASLDSKGSIQWTYENYCPITSFASSKGGTVAGYADGTLISFDNEGKISQRFSPGGSSVEVIFGTAISEDGNKIACVSGLDNQRFVLAEKNAGHSRVIFHEYIESQINRQTLVKFSKNSDFAYYDYKDGLGIVNLKTSSSKKIPIKGKISQIEFSDNGELVFILSKLGGTYTVTVLEKNIYQLGSFNFDANCSFIQTRGNALFVGRNNKISRISISRK